jgi:serine/threonine protein kinase
MPLSAGQTFAGYRIVRLLGSGGMGEVYLAEHPRLPRRDALKVLRADASADPDYRARFNREADLASKLWHPHIVSVHDPGEYNGQLWISMDFADGPDRVTPCIRNTTACPPIAGTHSHRDATLRTTRK